MAIKVKFSPLMLRRAQEMVTDILAVSSGKGRNAAHEDYAQNTYGLSMDYLRKIGRVHMRPSARVIDNMGLEIWVRDPRTGEEEKLELDYKCDWTPRNPKPARPLRTSPTSSNE